MPPALRPIGSPPPTTPPVFAFSIFGVLLLGITFLHTISRQRARYLADAPPERTPLLRGRVRTSRRRSTRNVPKAIETAQAKARASLEAVVVHNEMSEAPAEISHEIIRPKVAFVGVERRDSDSSIASAASDSTIDSEGPVTPDEEVIMHLGAPNAKSGKNVVPSLEVIVDEDMGLPVQSGAIMV